MKYLKSFENSRSEIQKQSLRERKLIGETLFKLLYKINNGGKL